VLQYHGQHYRFTVVSGGVGGLGAARMSAEGEVFNLHNLRDFPGEYAQLRTGLAIGSGVGELWPRNAAGVEMHLRAEREGFMLSLGADAVVIWME
jgi:hypothetical protein